MTTDDQLVSALRDAPRRLPAGAGPEVADIVRSGASRLERRQRRRTAGAASGAVGLLVAGVVGLATVVGPPTGENQVAETPQDPADALALLADPADPEDALPTSEAEPYLDLLPGTARLLGEADQAEFYVVTDVDGDVCLVTYLVPVEQMQWSCTDLASFEESGLPFSHQVDNRAVEGGQAWAETLLVPDSWVTDDTDGRLDDVLDGWDLDAGDRLGRNFFARVTYRLEG